MPLGPNTKAFFAKISENAPEQPLWKTLPLNEFRHEAAQMFVDMATPFPADVDEHSFEQEQLTLSGGHQPNTLTYLPNSITDTQHCPTILFLYGGGFSINLMKSQRGSAAQLAEATQSRIIMLDYPLVPEHSFDEVLELSYETLQQLHQRHPQHFMLSGCSSGATIAALLSARAAADPSINIEQLLLFTPVVDFSLDTMYHGPHAEQQNQDAMLTAEIMQFFVDYLDKDAAALKPLTIAIFGHDTPTLVMVGEYDRLRGDGVLLAEQLPNATLITLDGQTHNFMPARAVLDDGEDPFTLTAEYLRQYQSKS